MADVVGVRQFVPCARVRLPPSGQRRTGLFHGAPRKTHGGDALGRPSSSPQEPHSLGGGGEQHRGRRTETCPRGLVLAEPPLESRTIPTTEMRKVEDGEGIEGGRQDRAFIKKVRMRKWYDD
jgi:hypothetical protein